MCSTDNCTEYGVSSLLLCELLFRLLLQIREDLQLDICHMARLFNYFNALEVLQNTLDATGMGFATFAVTTRKKPAKGYDRVRDHMCTIPSFSKS